MNNLITVIVAVGVILLFMSKALSCPPSTIEYRYLPRTLDHLIDDNSVLKYKLYETVFDKEDIWYRSIVSQKL